MYRFINSMGTIYHILVFVLMSNLNSAVLEKEGENDINHAVNPVDAGTCYSNCDLEGKLDFKIFANAMKSMDEMEYSNEEIVTIIDFSKPSTEKRLFILDLKKQELLYHTLVAHGKNTGVNMATKFSNNKGSNQSNSRLLH